MPRAPKPKVVLIANEYVTAVICHPTPSSLAKAYVATAIPGEDVWTFMTRDGERFKMNPKKLVASIKDDGFWGFFCFSDRSIHIYYDLEKVRAFQVVGLIAHELTHAQFERFPGVDDTKDEEFYEECFAETVDSLAGQAFVIWEQLNAN